MKAHYFVLFSGTFCLWKRKWAVQLYSIGLTEYDGDNDDVSNSCGWYLEEGQFLMLRYSVVKVLLWKKKAR